MDKIKLQVLFLTYGDKYRESFDILNIYLKKLEEYCDTSIIIIDNKKCSSYEYHLYPHEVKFNACTLCGDNTEFEFSGWSKSINYLKKYNADYDVCLFINDSFLTNDYFQNKQLLSIETVKGCLENNALVGKCDRLDYAEKFRNHKYTIMDKDVTSWIRTNLFYMTKEMVDDLGTVKFLDKKDLNKFVSDKYHGRCFLHNADMSINLQLQMIAYITKYWHSKMEINEKTWDTWKMKCLTMCLEKLLYVAVKEKGYAIYDYSEFHYGK